MNSAQRKFSFPLSTLVCGAMLVMASIGSSAARAQTKDPDVAATVTIEQQQKLDHLKSLSETLQKDQEAVDSAVSQHGWDSNEADAAQQRLFQDRQAYRSLRRSLQAAGVIVPPEATGSGTTNQSNRGGHHCHAHGHHGCCGGGGDCTGHDGDCCSGHGS